MLRKVRASAPRIDVLIGEFIDSGDPEVSGLRGFLVPRRERVVCRVELDGSGTVDKFVLPSIARIVPPDVGVKVQCCDSSVECRVLASLAAVYALGASTSLALDAVHTDLVRFRAAGIEIPLFFGVPVIFFVPGTLSKCAMELIPVPKGMCIRLKRAFNNVAEFLAIASDAGLHNIIEFSREGVDVAESGIVIEDVS